MSEKNLFESNNTGHINGVQTPFDTPTPRQGFWCRVWHLYADGFRNMTVGRYLWAIILAKLAVLFLVFKLFFFPNLLERDYDNDEDRAQAVREELINRK